LPRVTTSWSAGSASSSDAASTDGAARTCDTTRACDTTGAVRTTSARRAARPKLTAGPNGATSPSNAAATRDAARAHNTAGLSDSASAHNTASVHNAAGLSDSASAHNTACACDSAGANNATRTEGRIHHDTARAIGAATRYWCAAGANVASHATRAATTRSGNRAAKSSGSCCQPSRSAVSRASTVDTGGCLAARTTCGGVARGTRASATSHGCDREPTGIGRAAKENTNRERRERPWSVLRSLELVPAFHAIPSQ
jgi:hypothetical protein